ncbi:myeloid leukemia factor 1-like protein [Cricetulus griseus]|nr:myeloid leukemia factor 1-like protein [Cricetulus griseus]
MFRMLGSSFEDDPFFALLPARQQKAPDLIQGGCEPPCGCRELNSGPLEEQSATSFSLVPFGRFGGMHTDVSPFQAMDRMMFNMQNGMQELQRNFGQLSMDPNGHSFCSSSVMTYSKVGDEPPKVFQASTQTRMAPGGIKETRRAVRDSDSGLEKMAVGHHIHDRAHVIKKSKNNRTGDEEVNQEFINMNECDAHSFDNEWKSEVLKFKPSGRPCNLENTRIRSVGHDNSGPRELKRREKIHRSSALENGRRQNVFVDKLNVKGSPGKITKK